MKIVKIWFDKTHLYGESEDGKVYRQSLLWYPALKNASDEEKTEMRKKLENTFGYL